MRYQWDETKRASNLEKHGIDFVDAVLVFEDPDRIEAEDTRQPYGETRWQTIGRVQPHIVFVVYTVRDEDFVLRIISARRANRREREAYLSSLSRS